MALILVVDDDDQVRAMLQTTLTRAGHDVLDAPDGKQAIELFRQQPADLVIMDIIMPEKEGLETILELKREFPAVQIIAISGGGRLGPESYLESARRFGAARAFIKPIDREELLAAIEDLLGSREARS